MTPILAPRRSSSELVPTVVPCTIEIDAGDVTERAQAIEEARGLVAAPRGHFRGRERTGGRVELKQVGERATDVDPYDNTPTRPFTLPSSFSRTL